MTSVKKSNDNKIEGLTITLPFPPTHAQADIDMEIYARFMRNFRQIVISRSEIRVLTAIQCTADIMDIQDAQVAAALVDMGLRAPRVSFPESYLECVDNALMRETHEIGSAGLPLRSLQHHWFMLGEDKFAAFRRCYPTLAEGLFFPT